MVIVNCNVCGSHSIERSFELGLYPDEDEDACVEQVERDDGLVQIRCGRCGQRTAWLRNEEYARKSWLKTQNALT